MLLPSWRLRESRGQGFLGCPIVRVWWRRTPNPKAAAPWGQPSGSSVSLAGRDLRPKTPCSGLGAKHLGTPISSPLTTPFKITFSSSWLFWSLVWISRSAFWDPLMKGATEVQSITLNTVNILTTTAEVPRAGRTQTHIPTSNIPKRTTGELRMVHVQEKPVTEEKKR